MSSFEALEKNLGYEFKDKFLLDTALTHSSYSNENNVRSYERLEFLGDAVIELVVSDYIFSFKQLNSGNLSKFRSKLVSTNYLCEISKKLGLDNIVKKSKSLAVLSKKNTADLFESVIGAIYLDGGIECAKKLIYKYIIVSKDNVQKIFELDVDHKTKLQELLQKDNLKFQYKELSENGPDHNKIFEYGLFIENELVMKSTGNSKRNAEENCAKLYLLKYFDNENN